MNCVRTETVTKRVLDENIVSVDNAIWVRLMAADPKGEDVLVKVHDDNHAMLVARRLRDWLTGHLRAQGAID